MTSFEKGTSTVSFASASGCIQGRRPGQRTWCASVMFFGGHSHVKEAVMVNRRGLNPSLTYRRQIVVFAPFSVSVPRRPDRRRR